MTIRRLRFKSSAKIAIIYLAVSLIWIFASDEILFSMTDDKSILNTLQIIKGWFFVSMSAVLIYFLLIKEFKKLEIAYDKIKSAEEKFDTLLHSATNGIIVSRNNTVLFANKVISELSGYDAELLKNIKLNNIIRPLDDSDYKYLNKLNISSPKGFTTAVLISNDNVKKYVEINTSNVKLYEKDALLLFISDISDLIKSQSEFFLQRRIFKQSFMQAIDALALFDKSGDLININTTFIALFNIKIDYYEDFNIFRSEILANSNIFNEVKDSFKIGKKSSFITRFSFKDEENLNIVESPSSWYEWRFFPIVDENENVIYITLNIEDITDKYIAEKQLEETTSMLRTIINNIPNGAVYLFDRDVRFLIVGGRAITETGWNSSFIEGKTLSEINSNVLIDNFQEPYSKVFEGNSESFEADIFGNIYEVSTYPIRNDLGEIYLGLAVALNITARKKQELQIQQLNETLEAKVISRTDELQKTNASLYQEIEERRTIEEELLSAQENLQSLLHKEQQMNEMKSNFVSVVTHEYRTPLTVLQSSAYLVKEFYKIRDDAQVDKHLGRIHDTIQNMTMMLDELLFLGRNNSNSFKYESFDFLTQLKEIISDSSQYYNRDIDFDYNSKLNEYVIKSDKSRIVRIFQNLINNACKYSKEKVIIRLDTFPDYFVVRVIDKGIGIPESDAVKLFQPFHRCSNVKGIKGTGLGLSIVKKAVDELEGSINFESEAGEGTMFIVSLPSISI